MENVNPIRGEVFKKFPNIEAFSKTIGWKRNKASRIVNAVQRPSAKDIEQMAMCLGITDPDTFMAIFFPEVSTK